MTSDSTTLEHKYRVQLVALHITPVCSHRCPMCYYADDTRKPRHPSLNKLFRVVDELVVAGVKEITLLGGDPGAYPHVIPLARRIAEAGISVSILSNTLRFPGASVNEAARYISAFETTIHDVTPEAHDNFCKRQGAYKFVVSRLHEVAECGRKIGIAVNVTTDTASRLYNIVDCIVNIEKIPLSYIIIQRIIPFGRAAQATGFTITRSLAETALHEIQKIDDKLGVSIAVEDPFPLCILPRELRRYMVPCAWGFTKAAVNENGDVSRCGADPRYRLGNIFDTPLQVIWNQSPILRSFRSREYLPGRCQTCQDMDVCGGGCPLSCEIEKDHGVDYLFLEFEKLDEEIHSQIEFGPARLDELSSILQIEWSNFSGYGHIFTVDSLKRWYKLTPSSFMVVRDSRHWVLGYAAIVPISKHLFGKIKNGMFSSLNEFPEEQVLESTKTKYFHIEVLATVPSRTASRAGRYLIGQVGKYLLERAKFVTASPVTDIGLRLCKYFNFIHVADEDTGNARYPVYYLEVDRNKIWARLRRF